MKTREGGTGKRGCLCDEVAAEANLVLRPAAEERAAGTSPPRTGAALRRPATAPCRGKAAVHVQPGPSGLSF